MNFVIIFILCVLCLIVTKYHWNRRWLYYHASKIPGPFSIPLIGSAHLFIGGYKDLFQTMLNIVRSQPPFFKLWLGPELVVVSSRPRDLEIILNKCFEKGKIFKFAKPILGDGLLIAHPEKWNKNRKIINSSFNSLTLHSFTSDFNKNSQKLVEKLHNYCCANSADIYSSVFCCVLNSACETLLDVDASQIVGQENYIKTCLRMEKSVVSRVLKIWYHNDFIWKRSYEGKEMKAASKKVFDFARKIIELKKSQKTLDENSGRKKRFLNHLLNKSDTNFDNETILDETQTILISSSESTSSIIGIILIVLGIYPEIQERVYNEIITVVGNIQDEITLDHINQMIYLDAVIKEALRIYPIIPFAFRQATEDIKLDDYTIPAGANIFVPILLVHKLEKYWKNPEQFNPDRFLNKEEISVPSCVYMPFSYGRRNCIGSRYAILLMKILLSSLLRYYKFESTDYKSIEEFEFYYHLVLELKKGFRVKLRKRETII